MTWTVSGSGTQAATIGTEHILDTDTVNGTYACFVDLVNMANGDVAELRVYTKVLSTGALDLVWKGTYANVQVEPVKPAPPIASDQSVKFTLKQTAGTGRNFDWKVLRI